jgi:murein DD-endopeptidase MepM/ murein hydrolase activator NlpD
MHILITHGNHARTRALQLSPIKLSLLGSGLMLILLLLAATLYHFVFLQAARSGWPVVTEFMRTAVQDELARRDRFVRENLDAMAHKVGEMQAKMIQLDAISERVSGLAGLRQEDLRSLPASVAGPAAPAAPALPVVPDGRGGPYLPTEDHTNGHPDGPSMDYLTQWVANLDMQSEQRSDAFTFIESRLLERRLQALMVPSSPPVSGPVGSGFGFRPDPFTGHRALHTGLDFPAEAGTAITAAAGGVVVNVSRHPAYGQMLELDHGNGLMTRYAHASRILVKQGDLIRRGQPIAEVGSTGRSTGPHLHFEVLMDGVPQDPVKFLSGGPGSRDRSAALAPSSRRR